MIHLRDLAVLLAYRRRLVFVVPCRWCGQDMPADHPRHLARAL